jgi:mono/diheme cytochrome c family protein
MTRLRLYAALAVLVSVLAVVLVRVHRAQDTRSQVFLTGNPQRGAELFYGSKRCSQCHAINGEGAHAGPDLGQSEGQASLSQLVVAMWNHAPHMLERLRSERIRIPEISQAEMADLLAFLYTERACDEKGDAAAGAQVFATKKCGRCHPSQGATGGADPLNPFAAIDTPLLWAEASWNHAHWMELATHSAAVEWPRFEGREMADLFAWVRQSYGNNARENPLFPADPERGAKLFVEKSCVGCHGAGGRGGKLGPPLDRTRSGQFGLAGFAGALFNHSPALWRNAAYRGVERPGLSAKDVADLAAYLYSLGYFEPGGTAEEGKALFAQRGCAGCHGPAAEGTRFAPRLRNRGDSFNSVRLAATLWQHGSGMLARTRELKVAWPAIAEDDVGDLIAFLNSPAQP